MHVWRWAIALGILGISTAVGTGSDLLTTPVLPAQAQMPTGTVCRVDEKFGVRCRDLEEELQEPPADEQTVISLSSYDRFIEIGRSRFTDGDTTGAIAYYTQAIALNSRDPQAFSLRGTAHLL